MQTDETPVKRTPRSTITGWYHKFEANWMVPGDESSTDRFYLIRYNITANVIANLVGGNFFAGLMLLLKADNSFVGLITMIIFGANLLQLFSPYVLERFERRKKLLISLRVAMLFINIVFIGIVPLLPLSNSGRLTLLALSVFVVNALNALMAPGFSVWHIAHIPQRVRVSYFSVVSVLNGVFVAVVNLVASRAVDSFKQGGNELLGLGLLRVVALLICVYDIYLLTRIRELPRTDPVRKIKFSDLLIKPWKERVYLRTVLVVVLWSMIANIPGSYYTVYLLKDLNISYSYITLINMFNVVALVLLTPLWRRLIDRSSWLKPLSWAIMLFAPHYLLLALVAPGQLWLYPVGTIMGFIFLVGISLGFTGVAYINIPKENQTLFIGFYSTMSNLGALVGASVSRAFMTAFEGTSFSLLGIHFGEKQVMMMVVGFLMLGAGFTVRMVYQRNELEKVEN